MQSDSVQERATALTNDYSQRLDEFVDEIVPPVLDNAEYAARCSALLLLAVPRRSAKFTASAKGT